VAQNFFGKVWGNSEKNPSHPQNLPAPTLMHPLALVLQNYAAEILPTHGLHW